jgi:hypothetical protein
VYPETFLDGALRQIAASVAMPPLFIAVSVVFFGAIFAFLARIMHDVEKLLRRLWRKAADLRGKSLFQRVASRINPVPQPP